FNSRRSEKARNLRQIFEDDDKPLQSETSNLRYQPHASHKSKQSPQQQKAKTKGGAAAAPESKAVESWSTIMAKVATGYKGSENVGRVGVALSQNSAGGGVKLIVYKTRNHLLSTMLLTSSAASSQPRGDGHNLILQESYLQFYDDEQHFWSLHFELVQDEQQFVEALRKLGLPLEKLQRSAATTSSPSKSGAIPATGSDVKPLPALPQPLPRHQAAAAAAAEKATSSLELTAASSYDSESESTQSNEDILVMPTLTSTKTTTTLTTVVPVIRSSSTLSLAITTQTQPQTTTSASSQLELYLDEQRATGQAMEQKMDNILQTMLRLAAKTSSGVQLAEQSVPAVEDGKRMDNLLHAMTRLAGDSAQQFNESQANEDNDNEDELLELEQKLLNFKKENRCLIKSLKAKEQALAELRASTCALCEQLLLQNNELKAQNQALIAAMSASQSSAASNVTSQKSPASSCASCSNCDELQAKIAGLERRVSSLQSLLQGYMQRQSVRDSSPNL
ncbi:hypothetical protein KR222_006568, partial [Zaprionus bogoriensis]